LGKLDRLALIAHGYADRLAGETGRLQALNRVLGVDPRLEHSGHGFHRRRPRDCGCAAIIASRGRGDSLPPNHRRNRTQTAGQVVT